MKKIIINIENERIANKFMKMISWMEFCGNIGHTSGFHVNFDGDGQAQIKVETDNMEEYMEQRKKWLDDNYKRTNAYDGEIHFSID